jgi:hypothetical protein
VKRGPTHAYVTAAVLAAVLAGHAVAGDRPTLPPVFTFSAGYKTNGPRPENVVVLGVVRTCGAGRRCMDITRYDSARMLPPVPLKHSHLMHAPYGGSTCINGPITTIKGDGNTDVTVALRATDDGFVAAWGHFRYRWVADAQARDGYTLADIRYDDMPLEQAVGFGFASAAELKGELSKTDLAYYYKGEIYHKTAFTGVGGPWSHAPSTFDFRPYEELENGRILSRSLAGDAAIVKKYGKPMWVQSSIVLSRGAGAIAPLVQEYGHDFNMDGCFNESGHNKLMLPVGANGVDALLYVEYTSDRERGFPMLSVGRYYR